MGEQQGDVVARLCETIERMEKASFDAKSSSPISKTSVSFPSFSGDESESDIHEFIDNYKRAGQLSGWTPENLATGLVLYLKGSAAIYVRTMQGADEMSFDELAGALVKRFASKAINWRLRQTLAQRVQLQSESVSEYACDIRKLCSRVNLPRAEWLHNFVFGLKTEVREHLILQQPDDLETAEELALLKEAVLDEKLSPASKVGATLAKHEFSSVDAKEVAAQVIDSLSKIVVPKENKTISVFDLQSGNVDKSDVQQVINPKNFPKAKDKVQQLMGYSKPKQSNFQRRRKLKIPARGFRSRSGQAFCYRCKTYGHSYYFCYGPWKQDPRIPRFDLSRQKCPQSSCISHSRPKCDRFDSKITP